MVYLKQFFLPSEHVLAQTETTPRLTFSLLPRSSVLMLLVFNRRTGK